MPIRLCILSILIVNFLSSLFLIKSEIVSPLDAGSEKQLFKANILRRKDIFG